MTEVMQTERGWVPPFMRQLLAVSGVVMYMIGTGANIAFPGVLLVQLRLPGSAVHLTEEHESWIASILGLALITGILTAPFCLQRCGRRLTNQLSTLPTMAGWALLAMAKEPYALLTGRLLQGFGMGLQAASAPVSIAEYSSPKHRGAFLATIAFSFATGMLLAHLFGTILYWRTAALACGSCYIVSLVLVSFTPETPPYLASKGAYTQCRKSFRWLRGVDEKSEKELEILVNSQKNKVIDTNTRLGNRSEGWNEMVRKPEFYKPTVIMIFMFVLFQVSGMTVVPSYTVPMMNEVTGGSMEANASMLVVDLIRFVTAVGACAIANRFTRRQVLFFSVIVTVVSLFLAASLLYLRDYGYVPEEYKWVPVIPTLVYIFGKTAGILPIPWAIAGEIFPLAYRSVGSGISGMVLATMFFVMVKTGQTCFRLLGVSGTFCLYGILVSICGGVLYFLLPETKGKTLYEIECEFKGITDDVKDKGERGRMIELENVKGG